MMSRFSRREIVLIAVAAVLALAALGLWYFGRAQAAEARDLEAAAQRVRGILNEEAGLADLGPLEEQRDRLKQRAAAVGLPKVNSGDFSFDLSGWAKQHGVTITNLEFKTEEVTIALPGAGGQVSTPIQRYALVVNGPAGGLRAFTTAVLSSSSKPRMESFQAGRPAGSSSWIANLSLVVYGEESAKP